MRPLFPIRWIWEHLVRPRAERSVQRLAAEHPPPHVPGTYGAEVTSFVEKIVELADEAMAGAGRP